jgi:predicted Rossmann fold nucleotide-binding protein DprA/Smf involved in DNA uptake
VAVLPYLFEADGRLSARASRLLRATASRGALASAVSENLIKDSSRIRTWLAARNRIVVRLAAALVVPEAKFKLTRWGTRYAVEYALAAKRPVVVLEPRARDGGVAAAFEYFRRRGAVAARSVGEALNVVERRCRPPRR